MAELTRTETFALTAIAYLQPVTGGEISKLAGREISRDVIGALKRHGPIDGASARLSPARRLLMSPRGNSWKCLAPLPAGLPPLERLKADGLIQTGQGKDDLDSALGLSEEEEHDAR